MGLQGRVSKLFFVNFQLGGGLSTPIFGVKMKELLGQAVGLAMALLCQWLPTPVLNNWFW